MKIDAVGHVAREADLVGDDQHRAALVGELAHDAQHLADELDVERRGRLVEQDQLGLHRQHAGDRHALLLAAGQPLRDSRGACGRGRPWRASPRPVPLPPRAPSPRTLRGRERHVLDGGQMRKQVEALEDEADLGPLLRHLPVGQLVQPAARASPGRCAGRRSRSRRALGRSRKLMQRSSVVLPDPEGPTMATTSPRATSIDTPRSTSRAPKRLCRSTMRTSGAAAAGPADRGRAFSPASTGSPTWSGLLEAALGRRSATVQPAGRSTPTR